MIDHDMVIRLAREAGLWPAVTDVFPKELERFAALVAAQTREECAKVCEQIDTAAMGGNRPAPNDCAAAIRNIDNKFSFNPPTKE